MSADEHTPNRFTPGTYVVGDAVGVFDANTAPDHDISRLPSRQRKQAAVRKYEAAVQLYASSDMSISDIAKECNVSPAGLSTHLGKHHRNLLFARYGMELGINDYHKVKVKPRSGQSLRTRLKYKEAVEACSDVAYVEFNVSQVARMFGLDGSSLSSQLRAHFPGVIENREKVRRKLGIADNVPRGPRKRSEDAYAKALVMYRDSDMSLQTVADACGVSYTGLTQFLRFYHKDIIKDKARRRHNAIKKVGHRKPGRLAGNGNTYGPRPATVAKYAEALELLRTTYMTIGEIADATEVSKTGFYGYLHQWHRGEMLRRRGYEWDGESVPDFKNTRNFLKSTAGKYAEALASLKETPRPVTLVAAEFGHNPDVFREYLRKHEPDLVASLGMTRRKDGKLIKRATEEKYRQAIYEYATMADSLKNIARRNGLVYNSLCGYLHRNCPDEIKQHQRLIDALKKNKE